MAGSIKQFAIKPIVELGETGIQPGPLIPSAHIMMLTMHCIRRVDW